MENQNAFIEERRRQRIAVIKVFYKILLFAITTYLFMTLVSPQSKVLGFFLAIFAIAFVVVVLFALYINYIVDLYKQIKNINGDKHANAETVSKV